MAFHFIAIASDYTKGKRIGWHYASETKLNKGIIQEFIQKVELKCGGVPLGLHRLSTKSTSFESVIKKDSFFEDIIVTTDMECFIQQIVKSCS